MIHKKPHFNEATTLALNKIQYTKVGRSMNGKKKSIYTFTRSHPKYAYDEERKR